MIYHRNLEEEPQLPETEIYCPIFMWSELLVPWNSLGSTEPTLWDSLFLGHHSCLYLHCVLIFYSLIYL